MNETFLALVEPTCKQPSQTVMPFRKCSARWRLSIEASCWLYPTDLNAENELTFCLEYSDGLKRHFVEIDRTQLNYLNESLLSGRFSLEGVGEFAQARLVLIGGESSVGVEVRNVHFNVVQSSGTVTPRYRLVA